MLDAENVLLQRFSTKGDPEAFAEIVRRHASLVYGACWRVLQDSDKAADVVQETFLQLVRNAGSITGPVPAWLHRVATHKAIDLIRKDHARKRQEVNHTVERQMTVNNWDDLSPYVDEELDKLDDQTREVLIQHFFEGRTTRDIGAGMRISQATVSRRVESGVTRLRDSLSRRGIIVTIPLLGSLLGSSAAESAPAFVLGELGKIAIVGAQAAALAPAATSAAQVAAGGILTGVKLKIVTAAAVAAVSVGSVSTVVYMSRPSESNRSSITEDIDHLDPARRRGASSTSSTATVSRPQPTFRAAQLPQDIAPSEPPANVDAAAQKPSEPNSDTPSAQPTSEDTSAAVAADNTVGNGVMEQPTVAATTTESPVEQPADNQGTFYSGMGFGGVVAAEQPPDANSEGGNSPPEP